MSNDIITAPVAEFTVTRIVNKKVRTLTETNILLNGKKAERTNMAERTVLSQWEGGHFASLLASFRGALGPMVDDCHKEIITRMNFSNVMHGGPDNVYTVDKIDRVIMALTLGSIVQTIDAKSDKAAQAAKKAKRAYKGLTGVNLYWHGVATDLTAKYKAAVQAKADEAAKLALDKASAPSAT